MDIRQFCTDKITIVYQDGTKKENVPAQVSNKGIIIPDEKIALSVDDRILRRLPSGQTEEFMVTDPGFNSRHKGIPSHYNAKYKRPSANTGTQGQVGHTFHINGANSRVNINSTDNSHNINASINNLEVLGQELALLRSVLLSKATLPEHFMIIGLVSEAEIAVKDNNRTNIDSSLTKIANAGKWVLDTVKEAAMPTLQGLIAIAAN